MTNLSIGPPAVPRRRVPDELPPRHIIIEPDPDDELPAPPRLIDSAPLHTPAPISWPAFWSDDYPADGYLAEPIILRGRQVAIYAPAGAGKSVLLLDIVAAGATGRPMLGRSPVEPFRTLYVDQEMTPADLRQRLDVLGYGPEVDLSNLIYFQLGDFPPLDTARGGQVLSELARTHAVDVVVVDTVASVVQGPEDSADTMRAFYRHTGLALKKLGVALVRVDHAGKDLAKGQRGTSAKSADVDVVFELRPTGADRFTLRPTKQRTGWVPIETKLQRTEEDGILRHFIVADSWPDGTQEVAGLLDGLGVSNDCTIAHAQETLREHGTPRQRQIVAAAVKYRREQV